MKQWLECWFSGHINGSRWWSSTEKGNPPQLEMAIRGGDDGVLLTYDQKHNEATALFKLFPALLVLLPAIAVTLIPSS